MKQSSSSPKIRLRNVATVSALALAGTLAAASAQAADVLLLMDGIEPTKGTIHVGFCTQGPLEECKQFTAEQPAGAETMGFRFRNVPAGRYAFVGYQDMDSSGKNERNMLGMPKEPFALSNGAGEKLMPPPDYDDLALDVVDGSDTVVELTLQTVTRSKKKPGAVKPPIESIPVMLVENPAMPGSAAASPAPKTATSKTPSAAAPK